jgi:GT2 family glycosyltransferase
MKYDIVVPHFGVDERVTALAIRCLETIRLYSKEYRLIIVDNGGTGALLEELDNHEDVLIIRNEKNLGFVKAVNKGLAVATAPFVVLMNNDTEAVVGWLERLSEPLRGRVGMSGPRTTAKMSWQGRLEPPLNSEGIVLSKTAMLAFFCVMFTQELLEEVGLLDEEFGVGLGDDDNYCARAHAAGFDLVWVTGLVIPHHHRTTFRALYSEKEIDGLQEEALKLHFRKLAQLPKSMSVHAIPPQPEHVVEKQPRVLRIIRSKGFK